MGGTVGDNTCYGIDALKGDGRIGVCVEGEFGTEAENIFLRVCMVEFFAAMVGERGEAGSSLCRTHQRQIASWTELLG